MFNIKKKKEEDRGWLQDSGLSNQKDGAAIY